MKAMTFSIAEALEEGWRLTKANFGFLIGYQIILFIAALLYSGAHWSGKFSSLLSLLGFVVVTVIKMGLYKSSLIITDDGKPGYDQLYRNWHLIISWVLSSFFFAVMFVIGLILLVIPGLYVWARYGFFPFFIIDKGLGPIEALKESAKATEGVRWKVFLFFLACLLINIAGLLLFGVGMLIAIPVTLLAAVSVYRRLTQGDMYQAG